MKTEVVDKLMTKDDAIRQVQERFEGYDDFINQAIILIASTPNFEGIESYDVRTNDWNWETYLRMTITSKGPNERIIYKQLYYRKGNNKYADRNNSSEIHGYLVIVVGHGLETEKYSWDA